MQTIQELADNFYTRYENHGDGFGHSSNTYNKRLCEQIREQIEYHVAEALKAASENTSLKTGIAHFAEGSYPITVIDKESILNSYPLENIK